MRVTTLVVWAGHALEPNQAAPLLLLVLGLRALQAPKHLSDAFRGTSGIASGAAAMTIECCHSLEARLLSCDLGSEMKSFSSAEAQHSPHRKTENRNCQAPITPDARECSRRPSVESDRSQADCSSPPTAGSCDGSERSKAATQSMPEAAQKPDEEDELILSESEDRFVMYPVRCADCTKDLFSEQ